MPTRTASTFPLPTPPPTLNTDECLKAQRSVQAELALAEDVWLTVSCVVDAMVQLNASGKVDAYLEDVRKFELQTDWWLDVQHADAISAGLHPRSESGDIVTIYASPRARSRHPALKQVDSQTLGLGGYRGLCLPWQRKDEVGGHYQATKGVVERVRRVRFSITTQAEELMADASQDPDIFDWRSMAAHGQTDDESGLPKGTAVDAEANWRKWVTDWFIRAEERCLSTDPQRQLQGVYLLGYALHAVEDVAAHRGRTNPEHAYNATNERNPDGVAGVERLAIEMAAEVLRAALEGRAKSCVGPLQTLENGFFLFPDKLKQFGFVWDGTPSNLWAYRQSGEAFAPHKENPDARMRWFGPKGDWPAAATCDVESGCREVLDRLMNALR